MEECKCCGEKSDTLKYDDYLDGDICYDCRHSDIDFCTSCGNTLGNGGCEDCMDFVDMFGY